MSLPTSPSTLVSVGGIIENAIDPVNPTTDLDASFGNQSRMECAMMSNTTCLAVVPVVDGYIVFQDYRSVFKNNLSNDAPEVAIASSMFDITFPQTVYDELNALRSIQFHYAHGQVLENWDTRRVVVEVVNAYSLRARVYDNSHALQTDTNFVVWVH